MRVQAGEGNVVSRAGVNLSTIATLPGVQTEEMALAGTACAVVGSPEYLYFSASVSGFDQTGKPRILNKREPIP